MRDSFAEILRDWHNFYMFTGGAATTLMGLVFVAASLGTSLVKSATTASGIRAFVNPTIIQFSTVLVTAALITIPTQTYTSLGSLLGLGGVTGLGYVGIVSVHLWRHHRQHTPVARADWFWRACLPAVGYLLIMTAAVGLLMHGALILNSLALAVIVFLLLGIRNAWDLFLWIAQHH